MVNKVILIGNVGTEPEAGVLENGCKMARFRFVTTEFFKTKDGERKKMQEWHNLVFWRNYADYAVQYFTKGMKLYVEGKLHYIKKDGKVVQTCIEVERFLILTKSTQSKDV